LTRAQNYRVFFVGAVDFVQAEPHSENKPRGITGDNYTSHGSMQKTKGKGSQAERYNDPHSKADVTPP